MMRALITVILVLAMSACSEQADPEKLAVPEKVVVIGDSISSGLGVATPWTEHFRKTLNVELVNAAVKNQETHFGLSIIDEVLEREKPSHVIILMGTNDAVRGSVSNALKNLQKMVDISKAHGAIVILGTLPPIFGNRHRSHQATMISVRIPYIEGAVTADVRKRFGNDPALFIDHVHPSDAGQVIISEAFLELFERP